MRKRWYRVKTLHFCELDKSEIGDEKNDDELANSSFSPPEAKANLAAKVPSALKALEDN
jgi:hypothetical protein